MDILGSICWTIIGIFGMHKSFMRRDLIGIITGIGCILLALTLVLN